MRMRNLGDAITVSMIGIFRITLREAIAHVARNVGQIFGRQNGEGLISLSPGLKEKGMICQHVCIVKIFLHAFDMTKISVQSRVLGNGITILASKARRQEKKPRKSEKKNTEKFQHALFAVSNAKTLKALLNWVGTFIQLVVVNFIGTILSAAQKVEQMRNQIFDGCAGFAMSRDVIWTLHLIRQ